MFSHHHFEIEFHYYSVELMASAKFDDIHHMILDSQEIPLPGIYNRLFLLKY